MSRRGVRRWLGFCAALALGSAWCDVLPARAADADNSQQVLILQNGRLLKGKISRSPNGYVIERIGGSVVVPFDEARVVGGDLPQAFQRLKESFVNPTAATHYQLALWCAAHELHDEMRTELVLVLDRDPKHEAARELLQRTDNERKAARKRAERAANPPREIRMAYGIELPDVESLAGLSRETAAEFTTRIQPLLLNKCGNASCHGAKAESAFRLEPTRGAGPGHRVHAERNLAAVLKQVELSRPADSALLVHGAAPHAGMVRANFHGPGGEQQLKMLRNWVRTASKELRPDMQPATQPNRVVAGQPKFPKFPKDNGPVRTAAVESEDDTDSQASVVSNQSPASATPGPIRGSVKRSPPLPNHLLRSGGEGTKAKQATIAEDDVEDFSDDEPDAFDPEEFNRRHHGELARPASSQNSRDRKTEP